VCPLTLGRMKRLEGTTRLVQEVLAVIVREVLSPDHAVQIGFEELLDEIDCGCQRATLSTLNHGRWPRTEPG
jgi:hypothetical protein